MGRACVVPGQEDVAFINCEFGSGTVAHIELAWLAPSKLRRTTVVGSEKMVVYDDCSNEPVRSTTRASCRATRSRSASTSTTAPATSSRRTSTSSEPIALQMEDFCRAIRSGSTPRSSAQLGLDVVHMIEAAERSLTVGAE